MSESPQSLSFADLEKQISSHLPDYEDDTSAKGLDVGFVLMLASFAFGLVFAFILKWKLLAIFSLTLELIGAIWSVVSMVRRELPAIRNQKEDFANALDFHYSEIQTIVEWLRSFPPADIEAKLAYVRDRQEVLQQRFALLFGSIDRVGLLTVVAALYLQFKDFRWHWPLNISAIPALCGLALLLLYAIAMWTSSLKLRLSLYERLLRQATTPEKH